MHGHGASPRSVMCSAPLLCCRRISLELLSCVCYTPGCVWMALERPHKQPRPQTSTACQCVFVLSCLQRSEPRKLQLTAMSFYTEAKGVHPSREIRVCESTR